MLDMPSSSNGSITADDADREQLLQHILVSRHFKNSPRLKAFLIYICERSLSKRFAEISELQIAVHVFRRSSDYNPAKDTIVRTAARQLRQKLELYRLGEGADSGFRLTIPKGGYIPFFERNAVIDEAVPVATGRARPPRGGPQRLAKALAAAAACGPLIWGGLSLEEMMDPRTIFWRAVLTPHQATLLVSGDSGLAMFR